jgi:hypothetical protein
MQNNRTRVSALEQSPAMQPKDKSQELTPEQLVVFDFWQTSPANFNFYPTASGSIASACDREKKKHGDVVIPEDWSPSQIETWGAIGRALKKLDEEY